MATQLVPQDLNVTGARLPAAYAKACEALTNCASIDECQSWANKAAALASYARQADDDTLQKQSMRIQGRAVRRCGELLKEFKSSGGRPGETADATVTSFPSSQKQAAEDAGMSERQRVTAVRVANVPSAHFEAAVESDQPPTVTRLADMGRKTTAASDAAVPVGFQEQIELMGHARRLAEFAGKYEPSFIGPAVADYNRRELRSHVARCRRFLDAIAPLIRENNDGV